MFGANRAIRFVVATFVAVLAVAVAFFLYVYDASESYLYDVSIDPVLLPETRALDARTDDIGRQRSFLLA